MKIGDRVFVNGYVDEIRNDCIIIRNKGGYFATDKSEVFDSWKAFQEKTKSDTRKIQVGDVVYWNTLYEKMIVIKKVNNHYGLIHLSDGSYDTSDECYLLKTGEHYDLPWLEQCR